MKSLIIVAPKITKHFFLYRFVLLFFLLSVSLSDDNVPVLNSFVLQFDTQVELVQIALAQNHHNTYNNTFKNISSSTEAHND